MLCPAPFICIDIVVNNLITLRLVKILCRQKIPNIILPNHDIISLTENPTKGKAMKAAMFYGISFIAFICGCAYSFITGDWVMACLLWVCVAAGAYAIFEHEDSM